MSVIEPLYESGKKQHLHEMARKRKKRNTKSAKIWVPNDARSE